MKNDNNKSENVLRVEKTASLDIREFDVSYLLNCKAAYNPRKISNESKAGLSLSIDKFNYVDPIIFNSRTERIVSGHQRLDLLAEKGYKSVQVNVVNLSEDLEKELNLAMNARTITGEFTEDVNGIIASILENDPEFYDMLNLGSISLVEEEDDDSLKMQSECTDETVPGMDLLPYESYDCLLVIFKKTSDFLYLSSKLGLDKRRMISAPMVKNRKFGKLRAISADEIIKLLRDESMEKFELPEIDLALNGE